MTVGQWSCLPLILALALLTTTVRADKPALSLVVDDLGYSFEQARRVLDLPGEHTFAIIPGATYSQKIAQYAHENGHEVMLHMPMQSSENLTIESSALHEHMTEHQITDGVTNMIREIPFIKGVNNHMGSRLTELGYVMRPVMETIKKHNRNFYFLDSRTTPLSTAYQQALQAGLPSLKRDVFLDYDPDNLEAISFQFDLWLRKAAKNGHAVAIAHPYETSIELLQQRLAEVGDDFQFMTISQLIQSQQQEAIPWPTYLSHLQKDSKNLKR